MKLRDFLIAKAWYGNIGGGSAKINPLTITENGTYTAPEGVAGYNPLLVNVVPTGDATDTLDALIDRSITEFSSNTDTVGKSAFQGCSNLKTVNLPMVKTIGEYAFGASGIKSVYFPNLTSAEESVFYECKSLETVDLPALTKIGNTFFQYCSKLTDVNLPLVSSAGGFGFGYCEALKSICLPSLKTFSANLFRDCETLETVVLPVANYAGESMCYVCSSLKTVDLPMATSVKKKAFQFCYNLTALILRSETLCTLENTDVFDGCRHILGTVDYSYNPDGLHDGYIYVPRALVAEYQAATNWSDSRLVTQFRALEDYTVDGTITGELDSTKI